MEPLIQSMDTRPINSTVMRFNAIAADLIPTQRQRLVMRLKRKIATLQQGNHDLRIGHGVAAGVGVAAVAAVGCLKAVDSMAQHPQNKPVVFNRTASFDRLTTRQTSRRYSNLSGIFTSAHHATSAPFFGGQWQGGYTPAGSCCRSVNPAICLPPHTFDSVTAAIQTNKKGHIMPKIRKAFSRPIIAHPLRTFPNLIQASAFVDRLTASNAAAYRFNIQQTAADAWTVARVVSGGAV